MASFENPKSENSKTDVDTGPYFLSDWNGQNSESCQEDYDALRQLVVEENKGHIGDCTTAEGWLYRTLFYNKNDEFQQKRNRHFWPLIQAEINEIIEDTEDYATAKEKVDKFKTFIGVGWIPSAGSYKIRLRNESEETDADNLRESYGRQLESKILEELLPLCTKEFRGHLLEEDESHISSDETLDRKCKKILKTRPTILARVFSKKNTDVLVEESLRMLESKPYFEFGDDVNLEIIFKDSGIFTPRINSGDHIDLPEGELPLDLKFNFRGADYEKTNANLQAWTANQVFNRFIVPNLRPDQQERYLTLVSRNPEKRKLNTEGERAVRPYVDRFIEAVVKGYRGLEQRSEREFESGHIRYTFVSKEEGLRVSTEPVRIKLKPNPMMIVNGTEIVYE